MFIKFFNFSNPREEMSRFMTGVSDNLQEKCHLDMIHDNMNNSHLMVHAKHVEEAWAKRKSRDAKRAIPFFGGSSKNRFHVQEKPIFKKWDSIQVPSKFPKARDYKVNKPRAQKLRGGNSPHEKPTCAMSRNGIFGKCLVGTGNCFGCRKINHKVMDCPNKGERKKVLKIKQVVQMRLQRITTFILPTLGVSRILPPTW